MLFVVATPIGNLEDLSIRQAKTLASSDIILAEDTRSAAILLQQIVQKFNLALNPSQKLISYYKEKEFEKLPEILNRLKEGKKISLISQSGMPLISDPGYLLTKACIKEKLPFTVIPGPSAVTTALVHSGFNSSKFIFLGFFPKKQSQIIQLIKRMSNIKKFFPDIIFAFYESPQRINRTLQCFTKLVFSQETLNWNPDIVICREMTKKFEEIIRGKAKDLIQRKYKGELTIVIK